MGDLTDQTELTTFSGDELFYVVEDDDGTPVPRKVTVENLALGLAWRIIGSAATSLTDHIPNNLTYEQWGTEEAVIAQASAPGTAVVVMGWLSGELRPNSGGAPAVNDRGQVKLEVSFDGGSTWANLSNEPVPSISTTSSDHANGLSAVGRATGTVTGDIQVRAMCHDINQANDCYFRMGRITVLVHPQ